MSTKRYVLDSQKKSHQFSHRTVPPPGPSPRTLPRPDPGEGRRAKMGATESSLDTLCGCGKDGQRHDAPPQVHHYHARRGRGIGGQFGAAELSSECSAGPAPGPEPLGRGCAAVAYGSGSDPTGQVQPVREAVAQTRDSLEQTAGAQSEGAWLPWFHVKKPVYITHEVDHSCTGHTAQQKAQMIHHEHMEAKHHHHHDMEAKHHHDHHH